MLQSLFSLFRKRPERRRRTDGKLGVVIELASFDKGGLEKVVLDSAIAFDRARFDVTIVTPGTVGHLGTVARDAGLRVVGLPAGNPLPAYERLLAEDGIDIAMSHFSDTGYPLFEKFGIPNVTYIHNVYAFFSDAQASAFARNDRYVDRYVSVSRNATRFAVHRLGVSEAKVDTIPNGLILAEHEARERQPQSLTRAELGLADTDYVFANVASYNLHKGHYLMADAMLHLLERRRDVKILCVGNVVYAPHIDALRAHLDAHGLSEHILMPGYVADVAAVHRIADAFLLPSFIEGWSIAMNEAMFYRKPMVLSDTGASAEVIEQDDIGILVPNEYGDTIDLNSKLLDELAYAPRRYRVAPVLADAMDRMASDRQGWRERGARGRDKIYAHYDFAGIVSRYEAVIEDVVRAHAR
ncbi:glycosyltransferase family 4 protein [Burkholderia glumae]|uniref:Glycosyltransferase family 4 protein n=1 Tax=Burkholderia glumae TaxID=337 RepID=A0AAP9Y4F0_BURGL|nr:glycosyltransferase family 4 protein [Burkholderia glumae]ACR27928.1 Glycosyltransferase-like protein [Burkholderia glumae BGR1]AJY66023.1 glycosyl transferases group 1 family protein [Burkholderia glumae LMG 2196 = ATCC 33617]KHJ62916.1 glycosyl transferase [Burkholderia glumae]MCM2481094.1 glycosyltransferase family 4 protein [Burkholderia glumae]MCM2492226.1 glycosyltransferase family 4 protein [Burkholderia glumae]